MRRVLESSMDLPRRDSAERATSDVVAEAVECGVTKRSWCRLASAVFELSMVRSLAPKAIGTFARNSTPCSRSSEVGIRG